MVVVIFVLGLIIGSFLNAVIYRLRSGESLWEKSSRCPHCRHELTWLDLVPLVSFVWLQGRCRYCGKPISWVYPLVEFFTGAAFVLIFIFTPAGGSAPMYYAVVAARFIFASLLIIIFVYDLRHYLVLDKIVWPAAALAFGYQFWQGQAVTAVGGALLLAGFFGLLYLVSRGRWIGWGDVKLGIFLGLLVPFPEILVLFFLSYLLGAFVSVGLLIAHKKTMKDQLPFGTFLTVAAFIAMLWGEGMIQWYFQLIGFN